MYLQVFGVKTLEIKFISDYQAHGLLLQMLLMTFRTVHIMLNIEPQIEKIALHLYKTILNWSKLIFIDLTLMLNVCHCLLLW